MPMDQACNVCKNEIVKQPVVICWPKTDEMITCIVMIVGHICHICQFKVGINYGINYGVLFFEAFHIK